MPFVLPNPLPAPLEDNALVDALQATVVGITGLSAKLVRPRWQPEPPNMPDYSIDWCAIGPTEYNDELYVFEEQVNANTRAIERSQEFTVLASFYGPHAQSYMGRFKDGVMLEYNRLDLGALGVKLKEVQRSRNVPALFKEKWVPRIDLPTVWTRRIRREYTLNNIEVANIDLDNEFYITPIKINPPSP